MRTDKNAREEIMKLSRIVRNALVCSLAFVTMFVLATVSYATEKEDKFLQAAQAGDVSTVRMLIKQGIRVNTKEGIGGTALIVASEKGHMEVVKTLLEKGVNVNAKRNDGGTALILASQAGHADVVKALLDKKAGVNTEMNDGRTALMHASRGGHVDMVRALLEKNAAVDAKAKNGWTALIHASYKGHKEIVEYLICNFDTVNDLEKLTGLVKLKQDINKILLTVIGNNIGNELYGTELQTYVGNKINLDYTKAKIKDDVIGALQVLQFINKENDNLDEIPDILQFLGITELNSNEFQIQLSVTTASGKNVSTGLTVATE